MSFAATDQRDDESTSLEPHSRRRRFLRTDRVTALALGLIFAQLVVRTGWTAGAWWANDDFALVTESLKQPLGRDFLFTGYANHLMPGGFLVTWVITHLAPWNFGLAILWSTVVQGCVGVALLALLRSMFGTRPLILVPLSAYLFSALSVSTFLWFSPGSQWLALQLAVVLALHGHVRRLRRRGLTDVLWVSAALLLGLFFIEKALLIPPLLFAFSMLYAVEGPWLTRAFRTLRRDPLYWGTLGVISAGWTVLYKMLVQTDFQPLSSPGEWVDLTRVMVLENFVPQMVGGPWRWVAPDALNSAVDTPQLGQWIAWEIFALVIALTCFLGTRALRAWLLLGGYVAVQVLLVGLGRAEQQGTFIGGYSRFLVDAAVLGAVVLGLALMGFSANGVEPQRWPVNGVTGWMRANRPRVAVLTVLVMNVVALSGLYSGSRFADTFSHNPTRPYVTALRDDLQALDHRPAMFDDPVPADIVNPVLHPYNLYSNVLRGYSRQPEFVTTAASFAVPGPDGHLHEGTVEGTKSVDGPDGWCGWKVSDRAAAVQLESPLYEWVWLVKIAYIAGDDTTLVVDLGDDTVDVPVHKGLHDVYVRVTGGGGSVRIASTEPDRVTCVGSVVVGGAKPGDRLTGR
jgi:hypothetical protein